MTKLTSSNSNAFAVNAKMLVRLFHGGYFDPKLSNVLKIIIRMVSDVPAVISQTYFLCA